MKINFRKSLFAVSIPLLLISNIAYAEDLTLTSMVRSLKAVLLDVQNENSKLSFQSSIIELSVVSEVQKSGKVSFFVATVGGNQGNLQKSKITLVLTPPDPESASDVSVDSDIQEMLASAISSAVDAINEAGRGQPPLILNRLEVELEFIIKEKIDGGLKIEFPSLGLNGGMEYKNEAIHKITTIFK